MDFAAYADGQLVLVGQRKLAPRRGRIGLWVDIGTEGYFANLAITPAKAQSASGTPLWPDRRINAKD